MKSLEEGLRELIKSLQGAYQVSFELGSQESIDKLEWLKKDNRDFLNVSPQLQQAAANQFVNSLVNANLEDPQKAVEETLKDVGEVILEHVAIRFQGAKRDVRMRPLSKDYIKRKGHNRIGVLSGDLFRDVLNAKVTLKKSSE